MTTYTLTEATRQRLMEIADMNADHESFALLNAAPSTSQPMKFLANATRYKIVSDNAHDCKLYGLPKELSGRWVALVAADDDCHLAAPSTSLTEAQVAAAIDKWFSKEFEYNSSMETRMRAAIEAAIKGGA